MVNLRLKSKTKPICVYVCVYLNLALIFLTTTEILSKNLMFTFHCFFTGIASMTVPVYIAEVSPPNLRGRLVTINTLFITGGQFFASVVDGAFSYLQKDGWRSVNSSYI